MTAVDATQPVHERHSAAAVPVPGQTPAWLTTKEAAARARCSTKIINRAVNSGKLRAAICGGRHDRRFRAEWIDSWLEATATPIEVSR